MEGETPIVAGIYSTRCGLQRGADLMLRQMRAEGILAFPVDLSASLGLPITLANEGLLAPDDVRFVAATKVVIHLNPPLFLRALASFPAATRATATIVGFWAWETNKITDDWHDSAILCDEIWAPSAFVAQTLRTELTEFNKPIRVIPHAVDCDPVPKLNEWERELARLRRGIATQDFTVGTSFSLDSNYARKNPTAAIEAFWTAFPQESARQVRLFVRCSEGNNHPAQLAHLYSFCNSDPRIAVVRPDIDSWPIVEFYNCIDLYISLHRSEGYGLTMAEASQTGKPVIATGWGLAEDIAARPEVYSIGSRLVTPLDAQGNYPYVPGSLWAEPDIGEAAKILQREALAWHAKSQAKARSVDSATILALPSRM